MKPGATTYESHVARDRREALILDHLEFVKHVLGKILVSLPKCVDRENLEAAGVLGLVEAAQAFDAHRGVNFKTFAFRRIRGAIYDELRRNCPIPQSLLQKITHLKRVMEESDGPVSPEVLAERAGLSVETLEQCLEAMRLLRPSVWDELRCTAKYAAKYRPDERLLVEELREQLVRGILALPEQERTVISLYYLEDLRLKEIGKVLNLSEARVSRVLAKAEFRLQQAL